MAPPRQIEKLTSVQEVETLIRNGRFNCARQVLESVHRLSGVRPKLRTMQEFLQNNSIALFPRHTSYDEVACIVRNEMLRLGPSYGRRTVWGSLRSSGYTIGQRTVAHHLSAIDGRSHERRAFGTATLFNPQKYRAPNFGYNLHLDQNEKLVDYGCVIVAGVDGCSYFCIGAITMPHKNNIAIYRDLFRRATIDYGLFESVLTDCGKEFYLTLFIQDGLRHFRVSVNGEPSVRPPYRQLKSTSNNRIERLWRDCNQKVTLVLKGVLVFEEQNGRLDMTRPLVRSTVSRIVRSVVEVLLNRFINSHNNHPVQGKGIPIEILRVSRPNYIPPHEVPSSEEAAEWYRSCGGQLSDEHQFGQDIAENLRVTRDRLFDEWLTPRGGFETIATELVNGLKTSFLDAIEMYLLISQDL